MEELSASKVFGQSMRLMREGRGWSQQELAERLTELGYPVHQTTVGKWEKGTRRLTVDDALAISSALSLQLVHMLAGSYLRGRDVGIKLSPKLDSLAPSSMRAWLRGRQALPWEDAWRFRTEISDDEKAAMRRSLDQLAAASDAVIEAETRDLAEAAGIELVDDAPGSADEAVVEPWKQPQPPTEEE